MQGIKKLLVTLPVMLVFIFLLTGMANAEATRTGTVKGDSVNLRALPETSAKVLTQFSDGTKVSVIAEEGDWYKVTGNDATGWIFNQFLTVRDVAIASGTVRANDVNVRSKPDTSSEVLQKLDKGAKVTIFERTTEWYRIQIGEDRYGWISRDFVTAKTETASRGITTEVKPPVAPEAQPDEGDAAVKDGEGGDTRQQVVAYAKKFLGVKYVYGASSPKGFDCSGFALYVFKHFGIKLERTSASQGAHGTKIKRSELQPGDLVFFDTNGGLNGISHVGIYIGDGKFIHASSYNHKVIINSLNTGTYNKQFMRARKYLSDEVKQDEAKQEETKTAAAN
jgi:cell wall-associated NlpC family hydrolase